MKKLIAASICITYALFGGNMLLAKSTTDNEKYVSIGEIGTLEVPAEWQSRLNMEFIRSFTWEPKESKYFTWENKTKYKAKIKGKKQTSEPIDVKLTIKYTYDLSSYSTYTYTKTFKVNVGSTITIYPTSVTLNVGDTYTVEATRKGSEGALSFVSDDNTIATVKFAELDDRNKSMSYGVIKAVGPGRTYIYAQNKSGGSASCLVTVNETLINRITLNTTSKALAVGESFKLNATIYPLGASKTVKWKSDNIAVATVDAFGNVEAKATGKATIRCDAPDGSGIYEKCKIIVYKRGDANGDGKVDSEDVKIIVSYLMGKKPSEFIKEAADMNNDGVVNIADIVRLISDLI